MIQRMREAKSVAVVGAGISGLICARSLLDRSLTVTVFEKSRGVGGRMATRRTENGLAFDHGAQYFTVRHEGFGRFVQSWQEDGLVEIWDGAIRVLRDVQLHECRTETKRLVGTPTMTAVCKRLAAGVDVRLRREVASLQPVGKSWRLIDAQGDALGAFDAVIVSAPSTQAARLLRPVPKLAELAGRARMQPCWAVMAVFAPPLRTAFDGAFVEGSSLSWIARNSSKPSRPRSDDCWVLHGSATWSEEHAEKTAEDVKIRLLEEFWKVTGLRAAPPEYAVAHRWRYAIPVKPLEQRSLFDPETKLGACGDWCSGPRVEGAFLSGLSAAEGVLRAAGPLS